MKLDLSTLPNKAPDYDLQTLFDANMHYGHPASQWHPKMKSWIHSEKNGVHIFDLAKTSAQLQLAYNLFYQLGAEGKQIVMVGTKRQSREVITKTAQDSGLNYIVARWLGGFLTNWEQVYKSMKVMIADQEKLDQGSFTGRTKYELVKIQKELDRMRRFFGGVSKLTSRPDAIFVIDPKKEKNAVKEANLESITVIGLVDSNTNPDQIDIVIPGNDDAFKSIELVVTQLAEAYALGVKDGKLAPKTKVPTSAAPVAAKPIKPAIVDTTAPVAQPVKKVQATTQPVVAKATSVQTAAVKPTTALKTEKKVAKKNKVTTKVKVASKPKEKSVKKTKVVQAQPSKSGKTAEK